MLKKVLKIIVLAVGILSVVTTVLFIVDDLSTIMVWSSSGVPQSSFTINEDSTIIVNHVDSLDYINSTIPDSGDLVIADIDTTTGFRLELRNIYRGMPIGTELIFDYVHGEDTLTAVLKTRPASNTDKLSNIIIETLRFLGAIGFLLVGLWAFIKRPNAGAIYALSLFSFSMAGFLTASVSISFDGMRGMDILLLDYLQPVIRPISILFGAFWLNLNFLFPKPLKLVEKHPFLSHLTLIYLPVVIVAALTIVFPTSIWATLTTILIMAQVWGGFIILSRNYAKAKDPLEKRQTRLVLWGSGAGLSGLFLMALIALVFKDWFAGLGYTVILGIISFIFLLLLMIPISFAYAFGKYRLLEVEGKLRRGTRFAFLTVLLLVVFYVAIYFISETLLDSFNIESRAPALALALLLAIGFTPAQRKIQGFAERKMYPERNRLREMLRDFLSQAVTYADKTSFWNDMENHLKDVLKIEAVNTYLYNEQDGTFYHWRKMTQAPFDQERPFIRTLYGLKTCPLMMDEVLQSKRMELSDEEKAWLQQQNIALVLPLETRSKLVGFIGLGFKAERDDYNAEECSILMSLASQIGVASENLQLLEDNIEKNRLEKELGMARSVQQGLLPGQIPETPGLEIAAQSKFCLEVAGDYYDVINIDEHRTVVAIGDVSGKGAAAALMMSNIQASFRTAVGLGTKTGGGKEGASIADIVYRINNLIHSNTPPGQFITFFVGVYDSSESLFTYVNAGHNLPMVFRGADQPVELLDAGGLLLGALPNMPYEQGTVKLAKGDIVFLYTDGVSEAENSIEDMYGEERIEKLIIADLTLPTSEILEKLEADVNSFIGEVPLSDDYTALVARVI